MADEQSIIASEYHVSVEKDLDQKVTKACSLTDKVDSPCGTNAHHCIPNYASDTQLLERTE